MVWSVIAQGLTLQANELKLYFDVQVVGEDLCIAD